MPYGDALSYRELAAAAGRPNAYRAVGSAMARNALPVILPCHRVVSNDGRLGQYGDDPAWKERLLALEGVPVAASRGGAGSHDRGRCSSSSSRASRAPASRRPWTRSKTPAGSASTTCRRSWCPRSSTSSAAAGSKVDRVAVVSDVRGGEYFGQLEALLDELHERGVDYTLVFLEASNEALVRRFKETRRRHPLAAAGSVIDGIRKERGLLAGLRERAHLVIDTSDISIHQLKARLNEDLIKHTRRTNIVFAVVSFGYKYGIPIDADLLFDVRFLPNPHYDLRLRPLTGLDAEVRDFVLQSPGTGEYLERLFPLLDFLFPRYAAEGKAHLTIGVGCTGGRHRSVTIAQAIGERYEKQGYYTVVRHRDLTRE